MDHLMINVSQRKFMFFLILLQFIKILKGSIQYILIPICSKC